ncbi:MAG: glycosyltransferase family 2 protein [Actinomycetota bacterium]
MRVDLIQYPGTDSPAGWRLGAIHALGTSPAQAAVRLRAILEQTTAEWLLFWDGSLGEPPRQLLEPWMDQPVDVVHCGLKVGMSGQPAALDSVANDWSWLDAPQQRRSTSWRLSFRCALVRVSALRAVAGLDPAFETLEGAALELGYRLMRRGAVMWFDPELLSEPVAGRPPTSIDSYVFVRRWHKPHWCRFVQARRVLSGAPALAEWNAARAAAAACERELAPDRSGLVATPAPPLPGEPPKRPTITAVIPTLGRYSYLPSALNSLSAQTIRPEEVIIVDQNPKELRQPALYEGYEDLNLRVIWLDERGQSVSRNAALAEARGEYVFLFEDDAIGEPDLIEQHLTWLQRYGAHVSTGVSVPPPPTDYTLPEEFRFPRVAQTFSSGNSLLTREALKLAGGFDRNYDHGVNADMDLGTRLYLAGGLILHNPHAAMIHYKAPMGGLRVYGHWWAHSNVGWFRPFPPPTQVYYMLRFLSPGQRRERIFRFVLLAAVGWDKKQSHVQGPRALRLAQSLLMLPLMPYRLARSLRAARKLLSSGPRIPKALDRPLEGAR